MKDISLSRLGQLFIATIGLVAAGCPSVRMITPVGMTPIADTMGCTFTVFEEGALWTVVYESRLVPTGYYVVRVDPRTGRVAGRVHIGGWPPRSFGVGEGTVWVAVGEYAAEIYKIDALMDRVVATVPVGAKRIILPGGAAWLAVGEGAAWAVRRGTLFRVDSRTNEVASIPLSDEVNDVFVGGGAVWVNHTYDLRISRIDPLTRRLAAGISFPPPDYVPGPFYKSTQRKFAGQWMAAGAGAIWVLLRSNWTKPFPDAVGRLDWQSNRFVATFDMETRLTDIAATEAAIWVTAFEAEQGFGPTHHHSLIEIDPKTNRVKRKIHYGSVSGVGAKRMPTLAVGAGAVWVCLPESGIHRFPVADLSSQRN